jgi:hypothetical protein
MTPIESMPTVAIAVGASVGGVVLLLLAVGGVVFACRKRKTDGKVGAARPSEMRLANEYQMVNVAPPEDSAQYDIGKLERPPENDDSNSNYGKAGLGSQDGYARGVLEAPKDD